MKRTLHPQENPCPHCGHMVNGSLATPEAGDMAPRPDDVSVCINCAGVNIYADAEGKLRKPTHQEMDSLVASDEWPIVQRCQARIRRLTGGQ